MGYVNPHMVLGMLSSVEAGLHAIGVPFTPGGAAEAARVLSASGSEAR